MSQFIRQTAFEVEYAPARITKWKSALTGLQLTYIDQPSPIVNGYFAVATEITNDSGCPHTLEHLIFLGSKKYPYKGLLDSLGNRFFSSTNAWTSVDQTVYTLTTAGWEGFRTLLPIYLDHLFHPTLTDEACLTEVYHVDGSAKEKGVVFSEMQGIESQPWFISYLNLQRSLYAKTSGYSSETGGLMAELRHLTPEQIRDFHKAMYRPDNMCVVITGSVDEDELLEVMEKFDKELPQLPETSSKRPFIDSPQDQPLTKSIVMHVDFPDDDESMGEIVIGWIGPKCDENLDNLALDMCGSYLTDSPISLLNKHLVEIEDPLATEVVYGTDDFVRTAFNFTLGGVPTDELETVDTMIKSLLKEQTSVETFDLEYMKQIVNQQKLKYVANTEKDPSTFSNISILEFIYGKTDSSDLAKWTKDLKEFVELSKWSSIQWCDFIEKYFVRNGSVTILGSPSTELNKTMKNEKKERKRALKKDLGEDGLAELERKLQKALEKNDTPIPDTLLTQFGKPDPSKIEFIKTKSYFGGSNKGNTTDYETSGDIFDKITKDNDEKMPLYLHFEDFKSKFVTIHLLMTLRNVPEHLLKYFSIIEDIFSLSIQLPSGEYIPYEKVISEINDDLLEFQFDNGIDNQFVELPSVKVKCEAENYKKAISWLMKVMKYSVFEESRIKIIIEKIVNSLPDKKRNEELMMYSLEYRTVYTDASLRKAQDCINTENFYKGLLEKVNDGKFEEIKADLEKIRECLFHTDNIKAFVVGGCGQIDSPVSSWMEFAVGFDKPSKFGFSLDRFPRALEYKSSIGEECSKKVYLVASPASDSSHLISLTPIPTDYLDEDIFKIALASELLGGVEGPFWRGIRGCGLAYGANIRRLVESGYLSFTIYRGADPEKAWLTGKKIISDYANGVLSFDSVSIENSIAAIVNELANSEANAYDASITRVTDVLFKKRGANFITHFLLKLNSYTNDDVVFIMKKYFLPLFTPSTSLVFACIPKDKEKETQLFFVDKGYDVTIEELNSAGDFAHGGEHCHGHSHSHSHSHSEESEEEGESERFFEYGSDYDSEFDHEGDSDCDSNCDGYH